VSKTVDFDAFRAEQHNEPVTVKIGGVLYDIAPALPADIALDVLRINEDKTTSPSELIHIGEALFGGEEPFRKVLRDGQVTLDELGPLLEQVLRVYTDKMSSDPNPKAQA